MEMMGQSHFLQLNRARLKIPTDEVASSKLEVFEAEDETIRF